MSASNVVICDYVSGKEIVVNKFKMFRMNSNKRLNGFSTAEHKSKHSREDSDHEFSLGFSRLEPQSRKSSGEDHLKQGSDYCPDGLDIYDTKEEDELDISLLLATVLGEHRGLKVLKPKNLEELKRAQVATEAQIRGVQQKLSMESKMQAATHSLQRLQHDNSFDAGTAMKQKHLLQELSSLQMRSKDLQSVLLQHTVSVFRISHGRKSLNERTRKSTSEIANHGMANGLTQGSNQLNGVKGNLQPDLNFRNNSFYHLPDDLNLVAAELKSTVQVEKKLKEHWNSDIQLTVGRLKRLNENVERIVNSSTYTSYEHEWQDQLPDINEPGNGDNSSPLEFQLDKLGKGLENISHAQNSLLHDLRQTQGEIESRLNRMNSLIHDTLSITWNDNKVSHQLPAHPASRRPEEYLDYLENYLAIINREEEMKKHLEEARAKVDCDGRRKQIEDVLMGLWEILGSDDKLSRSASESIDGESQSREVPIYEFSAKVQGLFKRATQQAEQLPVLQRQIEQQRDLNAKAEERKDAEIAELTSKISQLEASNMKQSATQADLSFKDDELSQVRRNADIETRAHQEQIKAFEIALESLKKETSEQAKTLTAAKESRDKVEKSLHTATSNYKEAEEERKHFESQVVRLQTELTIARAELDASGATRSQQAAQAAAENATQQQLASLSTQCDALRVQISDLQKERNEAKATAAAADQMRIELKETLVELEALTKAGVEAERERESLELAADDLRERVESLETRLAEERISGLDVRSPKSGGGTAATNGESTSTVVLKAEFKRLMREDRANGFKALKVSPL